MKRITQFLSGHWQLIGLTVLIYAAWNTDVIWPLRVLVVLFHELAHAGVAILTGGEVIELSINRREGGFVRYRGGSFFWTATAGYLGSLIIGAGLMMGAVLTRFDRAILMGLGAIILVTVLFLVRDGFAIIFMSLSGLAFIGIGYALPAQVSDLVLRLIGLVSLLYAPWDIASDTVFRGMRMTPQTSDAAAFAARYGLTEGIVGTLWILISIGVIFATLRLTLRNPSNLSFQPSTDTR